ncbi:MAG TPA: HDOD domain-containing protein [Dongiaceae bacterium]|nr:HDOD domain-containing protein [Dongiaceae bacterium]
MAIAVSLQRYFERKGIQYKAHPHVRESSLSKLCFELGIDPRQVAVPVLLQSTRKASLMAVLPLSHGLDMNRVEALLRREFTWLDDHALSQRFLDVEPGAEPPLPEPYDLPCIIDRSLLDCDRVFFRAGTHSCLISVDADSFQYLFSAFPKAVIANPLHTLEAESVPAPGDTDRIRQHLDKMHRLPAMPAMALKIIQLVSDPRTTAIDLAEAVELDPSMAAQIVRYAGSPYYGYRGKVDSVQDAISRVLGFDLVSNIALGISSGRAFKVPQDGPLGLKAFWKHALYCAVVAQSLARKIDQPDLINPATAYLAGLLHNIGVLLLGHLFPPEFCLLNKLAAKHPEKPLHAIEKDMIGMGQASQLIALGHDQIGGVLLEKWRLPEAVVACCFHHHDDHYSGPHQDYVRLIQLSNRLLAQRQIGDLGIPDSLVQGFGSQLISFNAAEAVFEKVMELCPEIDSLANHIAA